MELLLEYKWELLFGFEILAWIFTFLMFYMRYWIGSNTWFIFMTSLAVLTGWVPHITLMVINFVKYREINFFIIVLLSIIIFGLTYGKKSVKVIDNKMFLLVESKKKKKNEEETFS